jgi:hypothetical protein
MFIIAVNLLLSLTVAQLCRDNFAEINWSFHGGDVTEVSVAHDDRVYLLSSESKGQSGNEIYKESGEEMSELVPSNGAERIAVNDTTLWIIDSKRDIYRQGETNGWILMGKDARELAFGGGQGYSLGTEKFNGGYIIKHLNNGKWDNISRGAIRIAVDNQGVLWIVTDQSQIFRLNDQTSWEQIPGQAKDISIGADGSIFILGLAQVPGG